MSESEMVCVNREGLEGIIEKSRQGDEVLVPIRYEPYISLRGNLIVNFENGPQIATSVIDRDYFVKEWFKPSELEVAARFEESTQQVLKALGSRVYSGLPQYSHIDRETELIFEIAKNADVPLDLRILLAAIGHDRIEDHPNIRAVRDEWENAVINGNHEKIRDLGEQLTDLRNSTRTRMEKELLGYLNNIGGISKDERHSLRNDIIHAVKRIYHLTRFSDDIPYAISMGFQYTRRQSESLDNTFRRFLIKNCDRIVNLREMGALYSDDVMRQIAMAFDDEQIVSSKDYAGNGSREVTYRVGEELTKRLGKVREYGVEMPATVKIGTGFKSMFPLQYLNNTLNYLAGRVSLDARSSELLKLVEHSKGKMIEATGNSFDSAIAMYESDPDIFGMKGAVDSEVERNKRDMFYFRVTLDGSIKDWIIYDAGGRKFVEALDNIPYRKPEFYRQAMHFRENISMFGLFYEKGKVDGMGRSDLITDPSVAYDPKKHDYFTMQGVDNLLRLMRGDDFHQIVGRLKYQLGLANGTGQK